MKHKKGRPRYLRIVNERMLYLSAACAEQLGKRVDIFENGDVVALVTRTMGQYHLSPKSDQCRGLNLCAMELVSYLRKKYQLENKGKLDAWIPPNDAEQVVFISNRLTEEIRATRFDECFRKIELSYQKRYGDWVFVEDNCMSFSIKLREQLPKQMSFYRAGDTLALLADEDGPYRLEYRSGRKGTAIYATLLTEYMRNEFGGGQRSLLLHARTMENGICFSLAEESLQEKYIQNRFSKCDLGMPRDKFLCLSTKSAYLSSRAARCIGERFSLYHAGGLLALCNEADGDFAVRTLGYQNLIYSKKLREIVASYYPSEKKLYLQDHKQFFLMSVHPNDNVELPGSSEFQKIQVSNECIAYGLPEKQQTPSGRAMISLPR